MSWNIDQVVPADLLSQAGNATASLHEAKGLRFEVDAQPDLPAVLADHDRIVQVLNNLISNAVKFTPQGSIRCAVRRLGVALVQFALVDTGLGLDPDRGG